ncbi:MAG: MFS transporter, partial [Bifidobacteriaceae bacterium]|nr:MFS transporter [Bifidobacteriaceae bacterium]
RGAAVLATGLAALILALLQGGSAWPWLSWPSLAALGLGGLALGLFPLTQRGLAEGVVDLRLLGRPLIRTTALISCGVGALLVGLTTYVPTYLETLAKLEPLQAGVAVMVLALAWPGASALAGRGYLRHGFRRTILLGAGIAFLGAACLAATGPWPSLARVAGACGVIGLGLGWTAAPSLIAAQSSVEWRERGMVTGVSMFARTAGGSLGAAIYGAIANNLAARGLGAGHYDTMLAAFTWVFAAAAATAGLMWLACLALPPGRADGPAYTP